MAALPGELCEHINQPCIQCVDADEPIDDDDMQVAGRRSPFTRGAATADGPGAKTAVSHSAARTPARRATRAIMLRLATGLCCMVDEGQEPRKTGLTTRVMLMAIRRQAQS